MCKIIWHNIDLHVMCDLISFYVMEIELECGFDVLNIFNFYFFDIQIVPLNNLTLYIRRSLDDLTVYVWPRSVRH